jgi:hypothetical protein
MPAMASIIPIPLRQAHALSHPPHQTASPQEVRMTIPLDLLFALAPLVILAVLRFLDD